MDLDDFIEFIKAIAPIIAAALSAWAVMASRKAVIVSERTAKAVDGKMSEVIEIVSKVSKLEGKEEVRQEMAMAAGIGAAAVLAERDRIPVVTPAAVAESLIEKPAGSVIITGDKK